MTVFSADCRLFFYPVSIGRSVRDLLVFARRCGYLTVLFSLAVAVCVVTAMGLGACRQQASNDHELPKLVLRPNTPNVRFTWIDAVGEYHVEQSIEDIPEDFRNFVRITTPTHGDGILVYVADLRVAKPDGTYRVYTYLEAAWAHVADQRRPRFVHLAPDPPDRVVPPEFSLPVRPQGVTVIVYGTKWCGACRVATAQLRKKKGISVRFVDLEREEGAIEEMQDKLENAGYPRRQGIPVIDINGQVFVGYNRVVIDRAVRKAQSAN